MCVAFTLPADLSDDERAVVEAMRAEATREAEERAALAVRVRREITRLYRRGTPLKSAFQLVAADERFPVSYGVAENIWRRRFGWDR